MAEDFPYTDKKIYLILGMISIEINTQLKSFELLEYLNWGKFKESQ